MFQISLGGPAHMPRPPEDHRFTVVPDWVCEILSKSTSSIDREVKMPIYAQFGVAHVWLLDPEARTLDAYALEGGGWREISRFAGAGPISVAPFDAVTFNLSDVWIREWSTNGETRHGFSPMRLMEDNGGVVRETVQELLGNDVKVRLVRSRVDDSARGGDIDLPGAVPRDVLHPAMTAARLATRLESRLEGRKVDVVLGTPQSG